MRADAAFDAVVRANLAHLRANERGMLVRADPEYLHQMRVALRRLRSAIGTFGHALPGVNGPLRGELRWAARELGVARDWDVFVTETLPCIETDLQTRLRRIRARCVVPRRRARGDARRAVRSARYRDLMSALAGDGSSPPRTRAAALVQPRVEDYAPAVLDWRYRRLVKSAAKPGKLPPRAAHRFRIELKKFRYAAHFFSGLFDRRAERVAMTRLSRLQDILGAINDAAAAADLADRVNEGSARGLAEEKRLVLAWKRRRIEALRRELAEAWKQFHAGGPYWQDRQPG